MELHIKIQDNYVSHMNVGWEFTHMCNGGVVGTGGGGGTGGGDHCSAPFVNINVADKST